MYCKPLRISCSLLPSSALLPVVSLRRGGSRQRAPSPVCLDDSDLMASLKARMATTEAPPLGIDDVGAESMGPDDVISYVMAALGKNDFKTLLAFSVKDEDGKYEDMLGQLLPGAFGDPEAFRDFLAGHDRYSTLTRLDEWKKMGAPDFKNMGKNGAQKLLVRRDGANWEDFFINFALVEAPTGMRWLITSIYKQGNAQ